MASKAMKVEPPIEQNIDAKLEPTESISSGAEVQSAHFKTLDKGAIAARAYELWILRGRPIGSDQEDWFRAEDELRQGRGINPTAA